MAARMTLRYPASLLVALGNFVFLVLTIVVPIGGMILLAMNDPAKAEWILHYVFQFWPVAEKMDAFEAGTGTLAGVQAAFFLWFLCLYVSWVTLVTLGTLVTTTIIMHTGIMQLRGQKPTLRAGWLIAKRNFWRLAGLALLAGIATGIAKRFIMLARPIPIVGKRLAKVVLLAINAALYIALPVIVYERKGPWAAFRSTIEHVRKTWGGLAVGTGLVMTSLWMLLWFVEYAILFALEMILKIPLVDWKTLLILQLAAAVILYATNVTLAANLRAALYLHVAEGRADLMPEGAIRGTPLPPAPRRQTTFEVVARS